MWSNKYIGIPYKEYGRDTTGTDCWGLAYLVYKEQFDIDLPSFVDDYSINNREHIAEIIARNKESWKQIDEPKEGSLVLFRILGAASHIGIVVSKTHFIHARDGYDTSLEAFDSTNWNKRILGYFEYEAKAESLPVTAVPHPLQTRRITFEAAYGSTISEILQQVDVAANISPELKKRVIVLLNGQILPESEYYITKVKHGDTLEYRALPGKAAARLILTLVIVYVAIQTGVAFGAAIGGAEFGLGIGTAAGTFLVQTAVTLVGTALLNAIMPIRPPPSAADPGTGNTQYMFSGAANQMNRYASIPFVLGKLRITPPLGAQNFIRYGAYEYNGIVDNADKSYLDMLLVWGYGPLNIDTATLKIGEVLLAGNYEGLNYITLDRKTTPTTTQLSSFNAIYGKDREQNQIGIELTCDGLPTSPGTAWTPTLTSGIWTESGFSSPSDKISVALHFSQGLRSIKTTDGSQGAAPVKITLQYKVNTGAWQTWTTKVIGGTLDANNRITGGAPRKDAFTWVISLDRGVLWSATDLITVRARRDTGDNTEPNKDYRYSHTVIFQDATSTRNTAPAIDPKNATIAKTALTMQASEQLNNQIEGINAVVQTYCLDWNGSSWVSAATSNPASLFRHVLQSAANPQRVLDSEISEKINLTQLQYWHTFCNQNRVDPETGATYKYEFNSVITAQRSVLEILRDICAAGKASPAMQDGKWTVVIDEPRAAITQHFSPHNSWGFESSKALPKLPDAIKVQYFDESNGYQEAELIIPFAGKTLDDCALFENISLPGVTNKYLAKDHARWHMAQAKLRPEVYTLNTDIEYIVCNRGDRVKVSHDVPMWGLGSGRITARLSATVLDIDESMPVGNTAYTMRVRSKTGGSTTYTIKNTFTVTTAAITAGVVTLTFTGTGIRHPFLVGDIATISSAGAFTYNGDVTITDITASQIKFIVTGYTTLAATAVTATAVVYPNYYNRIAVTANTTLANVDVEDLFLYGENQNESQDLVVLSIEPIENKSARLTLVDYGVTNQYNIFTDYLSLSSSTVFETQITLPPVLSINSLGDKLPTITGAVSDETVMERLAPGIFRYKIKLSYTNDVNLPNSTNYVEAQFDYDNATDTIGLRRVNTSFDSGSIELIDVEEQVTYKIRLRYVGKDNRTSKWTDWYTHTVVGKTTIPSNVTGLNKTLVAGTGLQLTWDTNSEIDILGYEVRTSDSGWGINTNYVYNGANNTILVQPPAANSTSVWYVKAFDANRLYSATSISTTYTTAALPNVVLGTISHSFNSSSLTASTVEVTWANVSPDFGLNYYNVTYNNNTKRVGSNVISIPANWNPGDLTIKIETIDSFGNKSTGTNYTIAKSLPNAPTTLDAVVNQGILNLSWSNSVVSTLAIWGYEVSTSSTFVTGQTIFKGSATTCQVPKDKLFVGNNEFYVRAIDVDGRLSTSKQKIYILQIPNNIVDIRPYWSTSSLTEATVEFRWDEVVCPFGTSYYELSYTDVVDETLITKQTFATSIIVPANWVDNKLFTVKVVDNLGNSSTGYSEYVEKLLPGQITDYRVQIIDNNVLLYWTYPLKTTLPISFAALRKGISGDTWDTAEDIGTKSGGFTSFSELEAGSYVYFIKAVDTDNRESANPAAIAATVSQPPDFKFFDEFTSTFTGADVVTSNAKAYAGEIFLPVNTTETWQTHFTSRSWLSPQDQVNALYPIFIQPGTTSPGYYEEIFDYGNILGSSQITITKLESTIIGSVDVDTKISVSANKTTGYVDFGGASTVFATAFRYIKVRVTVTPITLGSIYKLSSLKIRLDAKQKTESGNTDVSLSGTIVNFDTEFVDVQSVQVGAKGSTPITVVYDIKDSVVTGTYSITSNICTITSTAHALKVGQLVRLYFTTGTAPSGRYLITSITTNTYTVSLTTANTSGSATIYPNSMVLYAFVSSSGAPVAATVSYTIKGY